MKFVKSLLLGTVLAATASLALANEQFVPLN